MLPIPSTCYRCGKIAEAFVTCPGCRRASPLTAVYARAKYEGVARNIVWQLKFTGTQAAARDMITAMDLATFVVPGAIITHVPAATARVRQRGFDQARLLARDIAKRHQLAYVPCLTRLNQARQVGASRAERFAHLEQAFRLRGGLDVQGQHIVLVDDVLTTGATVESAARMLRAAGAKRIDAVVFARA
jgi:ComF family protein